MTLEEIINREKSNDRSIFLYREGLFLRGYEHSAYRLFMTVSPFKILKRHVKSLDTDIVYMGFPENSAKKWLGRFEYNYIEDGVIQCVLKDGIIEENFLSWKESLQYTDEPLKQQKYRTFAEKTPIYKVAYDLLLISFSLSKNISKNSSEPLGRLLKQYSYDLCFGIRNMYEVKNRLEIVKQAQISAENLKFIIMVLKDLKEISFDQMSKMSEYLISVSKQLCALCEKAKAEYTGED